MKIIFNLNVFVQEPNPFKFVKSIKSRYLSNECLPNDVILGLKYVISTVLLIRVYV